MGIGLVAILTAVLVTATPPVHGAPEDDPPAQGQADPDGQVNPLSDLIKRVFGAEGDTAAGNAADAEAAGEQGSDPTAEGPHLDEVDRHSAAAPQLKKNIDRAASAVAKSDWRDAVQLLQSVLDEPHDAVYLKPDGEWRSLQSDAESRIAGLPPAGLRTYRAEYGVVAERLLAERGGLSRIAACIATARRFLNTEAGQRAADVIAATALDRGDMPQAATWHRRLLAIRSPLTDSPRWQARAAHALLASDHASEAEPLLQSLARVPLPAGFAHDVRDKTFGDWLARWAPPGPAAAPRLANWPMLFGTAAGTGVADGAEPLLLERWSLPLTYRHATSALLDDLLLDLSDNRRALIPELSPIAVDGRVAFRTLRGLAVADIASGRLLWENPDDVSVETLLSGTPPGRDFGPRSIRDFRMGMGQFDQHQLTGYLFRDGVSGQLSSDGRRLFSIEHNAQLTPTNYGRFWSGFHETADDPFDRDRESNQLVAFDFSTGRPLWEVGGRRLIEPFEPQLAGTFFFGPPTPAGEELYVIGEQTKPKNEISLFALAPQTGRLLWSQPLAVSTTGISTDLVRRQWLCRPSVDGGVIVCPTTAGWLVGVDQQTRRILWSHRYAPRPLEMRNRGGGNTVHSMQQLNTRWCAAPPVLANGRVVFTPSEQPDASGQDQPRLICLDTHTGKPLWEQEKGEGLYLAGVFDGRLIIVARDSIRAVSLSDGSPPATTLWSLPIPAEAGPPSGRGIAVGERYVLPLQSGAIWMLDLKSGQLLSQSQLPSGRNPPGNLVMHGGTLLSLGPRALVGFELRPAVEQQIAARRSADPTDLWAGVREAELHSVSGDFTSALRSLDPVAPTDRAASGELGERHRRLTFETLLSLLRGSLEAGDVEFERARELVATDDDRIQLDRVDADRRLARRDYAGAWDVYWRLFERGPVEKLIEDGPLTIRLDVWLSGRLQDLIGIAPPDAREHIASRVATAVTDALAHSPEERQKLEQFCGFHPAGRPLVWAAVDSAAAGRDFAGAEYRLRRLADDDDARVSAAALLRLGELLIDFDQGADAAACFVRLEQWGDILLPDGRTAREAAAARLDSGPAERGQLAPTKIAVWSGEHFSVTNLRTQNFNLMYAQDPVIRDGDVPFYGRHFVQFDQQSAALTIARIDNEERYWTVPLRPAQPDVYNQSAVIVAEGLQLIVLSQGTLHGLSLPDRRILWSRPVTARGVNIHSRFLGDSTPDSLQQLNAFAGRGMLARGGAPWGMLGVVTSRYIACYGRGEFLVLDPMTGELLWKRRGLAPLSSLYGDDEAIYVVTPNPRDSYAVRAADGREIPSPGLDKLLPDAIAVTPQGLVQVQRPERRRDGESRRGRTAIRLIDPRSGEEKWKHEFDRRSYLTWLSATQLLVIDRENDAAECAILDARTGERRALGALPAAAVEQAHEIVAVADAERVYVIVNHLRNGFISHVSPAAVRVNGTVIALDRAGRGRLWERRVENQNLLLAQFRRSPLLIFLTYENVLLEQLDLTYVKSHLLALDKQRGEIAAQDEHPTPGGGYFQLELSRRRGVLDIRSHNERTRIEVVVPDGGQAAEGEPG